MNVTEKRITWGTASMEECRTYVEEHQKLVGEAARLEQSRDKWKASAEELEKDRDRFKVHARDLAGILASTPHLEWMDSYIHPEIHEAIAHAGTAREIFEMLKELFDAYNEIPAPPMAPESETQ